MIFILITTFLPHISFAKTVLQINRSQSILPDMIHVDPEPTASSSVKPVQHSFQINSLQNEQSWDTTANLFVADNKFCSIQLEPGEISSTLFVEGFNFKIPQGSTIQQIRIHFQGNMTGNNKPALVSLGLSDDNHDNFGTEFTHKNGQGIAWPADGSSGSWYYSPNQTDWISDLNPDSINSNKWKARLQLMNPGTENLLLNIDQINIEIIYLPLYTLMEDQIGKTFLNISFIDSLASKYKYEWVLPEGGSVYNEFRFGSMINFAMNSDSFGIKQLCVHIEYPNGNIQTLCRDFLYTRQPPTTISVSVWHDLNADGSQNENEPGIKDQTVDLLNSSGTLVKTVISDDTGLCFFDLAKGGSFYLRWKADNQYIPTFNHVSPDTTLDNHLFQQGEIYRTNVFTLKKFDQIDHVDIGLIIPSKISGFLWLDSNGDAQKSPEEQGLNGIELTLYENELPVAQIMTDEDGHYEFTGLKPGSYHCCFNRPDGARLPFNSTFLAGAEETDNTSCSQIIQLTQDHEITNIGTGILYFGKVAGNIWLDHNENGVIDQSEPGIPGIEISLFELPGSTVIFETISDENGRFEFEKIYPGSYFLKIRDQEIYIGTIHHTSADPTLNSYFSTTDTGYFTTPFEILSGTQLIHLNAGFVYKKGSIGDRVWLDENGNGTQDIQESGVDGIIVHLYNDAKELIQTVTTAANIADGETGYYHFEQLVPGKYHIKADIPSLYIPGLSKTDFPGSESVITGQNGTFTSDVFHLLPDENKTDQDIGLEYNYSTISGRIWGDNNENGLQDAEERGISGVQLQLIDQNDQVLGQTHTLGSDTQNGLGSYVFDKILPGIYQIQMISGYQNYLPTLYQSGNLPDLDSDFDKFEDNIRTDWLNLNPGTELTSIDGGLILKENSISGMVWHDQNGDGQQNENEPKIPGISIKLFRQNGDEIAEQITDTEGNYYFNELSSGLYYIKFLPEDLWLFTISNPDPNDLNSDVDHSFGIGTTRLIELWHDSYISDVDAGLIYNFSGIETYLWLDENENGMQDPEESGLGNVMVKLLNKEGEQLTEQFTINDGELSGKAIFSQIIPGEYYLVFDLPQKYRQTVFSAGNPALDSDLFEENGTFRTSNFYLAGGTIKTDIAGGVIVRNGVVGDYIWFDQNRNGYQDAEENGLNDLVVELFDASNFLVASTISQIDDATGNSGFYQFDQIIPGQYYLKLGFPTSYEPTVYIANNENFNSKLTNGNGFGTTEMITVNYGDVIDNMDLGLIQKPASVGDFVWLDTNRNGIQDADETGFNGMLLTLQDEQGNTLRTELSRFNQLTGRHGYYRFESLDPGSYKIGITVPTIMQLSPYGLGDQAMDSDADSEGITAVFNLDPGQTLSDIDFGLAYKTSSIGDFIWLDQNENGLQDEDEPGLDSIGLQLYDESGELVRTTDSQLNVINQKKGYYQFNDITPGTYFIKAEIPQGYLPATNILSDVELNSDFTHQNGFGTTDLLEIEAGVVRNDIDLGLIKVEAQLGDRVWLDVNKNGIQEESETGLNGIQIRLYNEAGDWIKTTWSGNHPVSGKTGYWSFYNLPIGYYYVRFVIPVEYSNSKAFQGNSSIFDSDITHKFGPGTTDMLFLPDGFTQLDIDAGLFLETYSSMGDLVWEDINGNGIQDQDEPGINDVTVQLFNEQKVFLKQTKTANGDDQTSGIYFFDYLPSGKYYLRILVPSAYYVATPSGGSDPGKDSDITHFNGPYTTSTIHLGVKEQKTDIDIGLYKLGSVNGFVWEDLNGNGLREVDEPGINEVYVELYDDDSNLIGSVFTTNDEQTDHEGIFKFDFLDPGNYYLHVNIDEVSEFTCFNAGDDERDSDITNGNGPGTSSMFLLPSGQSIGSMGAGLSSGGSRISGNVWLDVNGNGLKDIQESGLDDYRISLNHSDGTLFSWVDSYSLSEQTGKFEFFSIPAGYYYLTFESREGYVFSPINPQAGQQSTVVTHQNGVGSTDLFELGAFDEINDMVCGVYRPANISGYVWFDENLDGIRDADEPVASEIPVTLSKNIYDIVGQLVTEEDGSYKFEGLLQGVYDIKVTAPANYGFTKTGQGTNGELNSDVTSDGRSPLITVIHGTNINHIDAGLVPVTNLIGGKVFGESDKTTSLNHQLLDNISFYLQNENGQNIKHSRSDKSGNYHFYNLSTGKYRVKAVVNKNYEIKPPHNPGAQHFFDNEGFSHWLEIKESTKIDDLDLRLTYPDKAIEDPKLIQVLPNPAQKTARFETNIEGQTIDRIMLFDLGGNLLADEKVDFTVTGYIEMDISFLPGGLYRVYALASGKAVSQKLLYKADE
ncbi:MAG TPA: SdrD B-like domain-containing protein [Saprospiraceae bacterium]|nr:SdrD B-like domain-containing protein [Saprospiraceae bacterium]